MEELNKTDHTSTKAPPISTVLVVDDDDNWCFVTKLFLKRSGKVHQIQTAQNGLEALNKLKEITASGEKLPEIVFLDLKMPVMDGFEFLEEVTKAPELDLSNTRIFICTSSLHPKDQERVSAYSIAGFIPKPLTQEIINSIFN